MKLQRRVVVTGLGLVTPLGNDVSSSWDACTNGISGISTFNNSIVDSPVSIGGRIKDLDLSLYLDAKESRRLDTFIQYGVVAASQAITDSGFLDSSSDLTRAGVNFGSGIGGIETIENNHKLYLEKGYKKVSPFMVPGSIINMTSGLISIKFGLKGSNVSTVTACSSGNHCIGLAARSIAYGESDIMVAGGSEMASTPLAISGFIAARALSTSSNPATASRPWDVDRDGFVLGDGAGVVVLEEYEHAKKRGARIYGELSGYGMSSDAYHMTLPSEGGEGAARCMKNAMRNAKINEDQLDYINAHGTSTPAGDIAETDAAKLALGAHSKNIVMSSTKSMTGHLLGAAGGIEAVFTTLAIRDQIAPPTINIFKQDPNCDLDYAANEAREMKIDHAISNSFGFGGTNGSILVSKGP